MKPITTNNLSAWAYIGLFILFSLPYIGTPAVILCAIFARNEAVKGFARAILILAVIGWVIIFAAAFSGGFDFNFSFDEGGVEVFRYITSLLG